MRELSLFSGAGGGLLGTLLLGWTPIGYVEYDDYCQRVIAQRIADGILPNAPIFGDIRTFISEGYAASYTGLVDVVTGGFPCQPFSVAGKRAGADDPRNMWPATIDTIRAVRPRYAFLENVPGLVNSGYFGTILGDLAESGYDARWRILSAAELGAPHKRDRLWICANAQGERTRRSPVRQGQPRQAATDANGMGEDVADTDRGCSERAQDKVRPGRHVAELGSKDVAHTESEQAAWVQQSAFSPNVGASRVGHTCSEGLPQSQHQRQYGRPIAKPSWWEAEPDVGRVAHGVASRVDRLKAIGNGQCPAVVRAAWHLLTE